MFRTALIGTFLFAAVPAFAQDAVAPPAGGSGFDVSAELNILSDYRFRGVSRSDEDPAVQAGVALYHDSGLYAGVRATSLAGIDRFRLQDQGDAQIDLYAGYGRDLGDGFSVDGGVMYYVFAGGTGATDHVEPYASLSYLIGPVQLTGGAKYAPSQAATRHEDMLYLYAQAEVSVPFRPLSFSAELGRQDWGLFGSYWTWSLGGRYHVQLAGIPNTEVGLAYVDSDLPSATGLDGGVVLSVNIGF